MKCVLEETKLNARYEYPRVGDAGKHSIPQWHSSFTRLGRGGGVSYFIPEFLLPDSTGLFVCVAVINLWKREDLKLVCVANKWAFR